MYVILDVVVGWRLGAGPHRRLGLAPSMPTLITYGFIRKPGATPPQPEPPVTATYRIKNTASGRYLTADGGEEEWLTPFQGRSGRQLRHPNLDPHRA